MKKLKELKCEYHANQKLHLFCKNPECWVKVCLKCAKERHKGHEVIGYAKLKMEAKRVEKELIQTKKGDLLSIKQTQEEVTNLKSQLSNSLTKHKEELKLLMTSILSNAYEASKETELHTTRFKDYLTTFEDFWQKLYQAQEEEVKKLPELANAVITQGTATDLKTFFEMCKDGININRELLNYKNNVDFIKADIEKFIMTNPLVTTIRQSKALYGQINNKEYPNTITSLNGILNEILNVDNKDSPLMGKRASGNSSLLSTFDESSLHVDNEYLKETTKSTISINSSRRHRRTKSIPNSKLTESQTDLLKVKYSNELKNLQSSIHTLHEDYKRLVKMVFGVASEFSSSIRGVINSVNNIREAYTNTRIINEEIQRMVLKSKDEKSICNITNNHRQITK